MMISGRNNHKSHFPFTASQWQELEQQLLTFNYILSGIPVPPELFSAVIRNPFTSSSSALFPNQQSIPFGWGCFQMGYGRKIDPEPGRCRRTDGKKWRCSKEACSDSKYCEKHMHRGKNKTKKQVQQVFSNTTPKSSTNDPSFSTSSPKINLKTCIPNSPAISCSISPSDNDIAATYPYIMGQKAQAHSYQPTTFYPFMSPQSDSTNFTQSTQNFTAPHWLLDSESYDQPKKEMRYL
ncbi:growth-regulating factor 5-like [Chenopodium quinoa]|uniref:growth-regulating factor 5-like n=1 Tax=Chenopodium quinoa TaxID=63459 RepID=UPI000B77E769|nr:growth-regulating factor 5-like [Chenopodium quinoa]